MKTFSYYFNRESKKDPRWVRVVHAIRAKMSSKENEEKDSVSFWNKEAKRISIARALNTNF